MPVDWSKYGIEEKEKKRTGASRVDWSKYEPPKISSDTPSGPLQPMSNQTDFKQLGRNLNSDREAASYIEQQRAKRDAQDPTNPVLDAIKDNTIDAAAGAIDRFTVSNPVGRAINRFQQGAGSAVGVDTQAAGAAPLLSTGNRAVDVTADVAGNIAGSLTNPSNIGQGLVSAPLRAGQAVAQRFAPRAPQLAQRAIEGGTAGAIQGGVIGGVRGETSAGEMARNVGLGAATGAIADPLADLAGRGIRRGINAMRGRTPEPTRQQAASKDAVPESAPAQPVRQGLFERLFNNQGVGIIPQAFRRGRNKLTTEGQIVDQPLKKTAKGAVGSAQAAARSAYQNLVDMNEPIKRISREAYDASIDAQRANQLANVITTDKFVTPQGEVVGEGLQNIVRKAGRGNYNAFTDYLIARHALTRMKRGERVYDEKLNMTPEKVQARIQELETRYPGFKEIGQEWDQYYRNIRQRYGVEEDLMPQSLADVLETENPNYAPMRRQFSTEEKIKGLGRSGAKPMFSGQKAPLQEVSPTGSTRKIVDPVRSTIEQTGAWVNAAMRNRVMKEIVNKISDDPEAMSGIAEIVQPPKGQPNLREVLEREGEEAYLEMLQDDFNQLFKKQRVDDDTVVRAMIKGEPVYVKVKDPEAVKALMGMGAEEANIALSIVGSLSNAIKRGATGALAPLFAVKGATMDVAQAMIQSKNPLVHAYDLVGAVASSIGDALRIPGLRNMAQDFYRAGGGYSAALRSERELRRGVGNMRLDPILSPRSIARATGKAIASPYKASLKIADIAENMNRIAAFNSELRRLGGARTPENIRQAMNAAREITTNYSRRGRQSRTLESIIPYNNAATQGLYRFAKSWKKNPVKTAAMVGVGVIAPKMIEYAKFSEDEDYQNLPAREKYRNLILSKNPDGTFNKIPMPPEYNALGALTVDMLRAYRDGDPQAFKGVTDALANAYAPPAVSGLAQGATQGGGIDQSIAGLFNATSVAPLTAIYGNQSFTGAPIVPQRLEGRSQPNQYDERTSAVAKWLGQKLGYSPMKVDYLIRAYGGDPARLLLPLTSEVGAGTPRNTLLKNFIVDPTFTNTLADDFYTAKERLAQARNDAKTGAELPNWYDEGLYRLANSTANGMPAKRLSQLNKQKREINGRDMPAQEKAQALRDIQAQINDVYLEVNSQLEAAGVPMPRR